MKWYQKTWGIVLLLLFFFPAGLYFLWKSEHSQMVKMITTGIFALMVIAGAFVDKPAPAVSTTSVPQKEQSVSKEVKTQPAAIPPVENAKISQIPGLGSDKSVWDSTYSKSAADNYANDKYIVFFGDNNRAILLQIQNVNNEQLDNNPISVIPTDSQVISSNEEGSDAMIVNKHFNCTSELLKKVCPNSDGNFELINTFDRQTGKWISTTVSSVK